MQGVEEETLEALVEMIRRWGTQARERQGQLRGELKEDGTYVTDMDLQVESELRAFLHKQFPGHRVLGEEGGLTGPVTSRWTWVIDPIDGTTNYSLGLPIWAISVALMEGGIVHWGCVHIPVLNQLYLARRGKGASQNGRPIALLIRHRMEREDLFGITSDGVKRYEYRFPQKVRSMGSAAAQAVFVACGHYVGFFLDVWYIWDIAAALLIALEAGAKVTDMAGVDFPGFSHVGPEPGQPLLFAIPEIHDQFLPLILSKGRW